MWKELGFTHDKCSVHQWKDALHETLYLRDKDVGNAGDFLRMWAAGVFSVPEWSPCLHVTLPDTQNKWGSGEKPDLQVKEIAHACFHPSHHWADLGRGGTIRADSENKTRRFVLKDAGDIKRWNMQPGCELGGKLNTFSPNKFSAHDTPQIAACPTAFS